MAPIPALPIGFREVPLSNEEKSLGLKFHLVRPGVNFEPPRHRRRVPIDDAGGDAPEMEAPVIQTPPVPTKASPRAELDVHRTIVSDEIRRKIIRLYTAAEPLPIRVIARRFGIGYKSVWSIVSHLRPVKPKQRPRARRPRVKRILGLAFSGSVALSSGK